MHFYTSSLTLISCDLLVYESFETQVTFSSIKHKISYFVKFLNAFCPYKINHLAAMVLNIL